MGRGRNGRGWGREGVEWDGVGRGEDWEMDYINLLVADHSHKQLYRNAAYSHAVEVDYSQTV